MSVAIGYSEDISVVVGLYIFLTDLSEIEDKNIF